MAWDWSKVDDKALARYVDGRIRNAILLPEAHQNMSPRELTAAIYTCLVQRPNSVRYGPELWHPENPTQPIRSPRELLFQPREGTCLDLAVMFCGLCLGYELLPMLVVLNDHAMVAVSLKHRISEWSALDRREQMYFNKDKLTDVALLRKWLDEGDYIAVECTGFAECPGFGQDCPEGIDRTSKHFLDFERAVKAGREQLDFANRSLRFALDIATAHYSWQIKPVLTDFDLDVGLSVHGAGALPISSYDTEKIMGYVQQNASPCPTASSVRVTETVEQYDLQSLTNSLLSARDFDGRIRYCAWEWLNPQTPQGDYLDAIKEARTASGLSRLPDEIFVERLKATCEEVERKHPALSLWSRRRCSLLDYTRQSRSLADRPFSMSAGSTLLGLALQELLDYRKERPESAKQQAEAVTRKALSLAGQAVCRIVSSDETKCDFWANLMLPVALRDLDASVFDTPLAQENQREAAHLWAAVSKYDTCLVVAAEASETNDHLGFWLPVIRSRIRSTPGALSAYRRKRGSALFLDDLPPFGDDLPNAAWEQWKSYLKRRLDMTAFVSIPLTVQPEPGQRRVLAVLNVNIVSTLKDDCARAYHESWLDIAEREAEPLILEGLKSFAVSCATLTNVSLPILSSGPSNFPLLAMCGPRNPIHGNPRF